MTRNAVRRAQREVAKALESQQGSYEPPKGSAPSKQWEMPYDDSNTVRLQFFLWRDGGKVVDFVINVQVITAEGWITVEYFDCCHGNCHLHPANDGVERQVILRLDSEDDVARAFDLACSEAEGRARIIRSKGE